MGLHQRDLARRFITFIDAAYESKVKILTTSEVPILQIFAGGEEEKGPTKDQMRSLMDDLVSFFEENRMYALFFLVFTSALQLVESDGCSRSCVH